MRKTFLILATSVFFMFITGAGCEDEYCPSNQGGNSSEIVLNYPSQYGHQYWSEGYYEGDDTIYFRCSDCGDSFKISTYEYFCG